MGYVQCPKYRHDGLENNVLPGSLAISRELSRFADIALASCMFYYIEISKCHMQEITVLTVVDCIYAVTLAFCLVTIQYGTLFCPNHESAHGSKLFKL